MLRKKQKAKSKKCLYINSCNIIKKTYFNNTSNSNISGNKTNETFNKTATKDSFDNKIYKKSLHNSYNKEKEKKSIFPNKDRFQENMKTFNVTEEISSSKGLLPSKSKTRRVFISKIEKIERKDLEKII